MRRSLTRAQVLRSKNEIAELFAHARKDQTIGAVEAATRRCDSSGRFIGCAADLEVFLLKRFAKNPSLCGSVRRDGLKLVFIARFVDSCSSFPPGPMTLDNDPFAEFSAEKISCPQLDKFFVSPVRRLGSAVQRNRAKRLQRELFRHTKIVLRSVARSAADQAGRQLAQLLGACDSEPYRAALSRCEERLSYHWGWVVYQFAGLADGFSDGLGSSGGLLGCKTRAMAKDSSRVNTQVAGFWPESWQMTQDPCLVAELVRYEAVLKALERHLRKRWLHVLGEGGWRRSGQMGATEALGQ